MTVDPHSFTIILQSQQAGSPMITCRGSATGRRELRQPPAREGDVLLAMP